MTVPHKRPMLPRVVAVGILVSGFPAFTQSTGAGSAGPGMTENPPGTPGRGQAMKLVIVKDEVQEFLGKIETGEATAYGFHVPPKGFLSVKLEHPKESQFKLMMATRTGRQLPGMLSNKVRVNLQTVRFENTEEKDVDLVVLVQGPSRKDVFGKDLGSLKLGETESYATPFRIVIKRTPS